MTKMQKPDYFDEIQQNALNLWRQLEDNRELAAPWHQLFKQVQSPRHVLSELLQNADDAKATEVKVQIKDGAFSFVHNGKDFNKDDFASLCRFGYSNKRLLRTIGFRGIGFKSTFSLGDTVVLLTPTLAVAFNKSRFTLPQWLDEKTTSDGTTQILVKFGDEQRQKELENNIVEWLTSPFSLLFFNHIRSLKLGDRELSWKNVGEGPILNSEKMTLNGEVDPYLIIRSEAEPFPDEALKEIDDERLLEMGESANLPPCKVELVLGAPGQFFVVLPTGVRTSLSFAVNAPFIQDPARLKIKDPETSFTNRWLLERIGKLAAQAMLQWLENKDLDLSERANSYDLIPEPSGRDDSLENACKMVIETAFLNTVHNREYVLTDQGDLTLSGNCAHVPAILWDIWGDTQISDILSTDKIRPQLLSRHVNDKNLKKLQANKAISSLGQDDVLNRLSIVTPPKPTTWAALLELWNFAGSWGYAWKFKNLNIHPVRGRDVLLSSNKAVRLGEKRLLQSEEDWDFLAKYLLVLDVNWLRFLTEQRRVSEETNNDLLRERVAVADQMLVRTGLDKPSNVDMVLEQVATEFFSVQSPSLDACIRITQIASKLGAKAGDNFKFFTRDGQLHPTKEPILFDEKGLFEEFIPPHLRQRVLLHNEYSHHFISCTEDEWMEWVNSGNARIRRFAPISQTRRSIYGDHKIEKEIENRGQPSSSIEYQYKTSQYEIEDWDFPAEYWTYWETSAKDDPSYWGRLVEQLLHQRIIWENTQGARAFHVATTGNKKALTNKHLFPTWILKLQKLPCLRDTHGNYKIPSDLMCRTPQTEPLMDVEAFVDARLDSEATRPLLVFLGVRNSPTGSSHIMERLRALAKASKPPILELAKWYQRLDALFENCSTDDQQNIKAIFREEKIIFADDETWQSAETIYISAEEHDAPGAALIHPLVNQLSLWRKISINERPTAELAIQWLMNLPVDEKPSTSDAQRIKALLGRHPIRIWRECERWLNLSGEWVSINKLKYCLTMKSLFRYGNLFEWVKSETADFQMLSIDLTREPPFSTLPTLASQVEKNLEQSSPNGQPLSMQWLQSVGRIVSRVILTDEVKTRNIRTQAVRLSTTTGLQVNSITTLPYLNGKPAGIAESEDLVWIGETIYIGNLSKAKLASRLSKQIAAVFDWTEMEALLTYCFERNETSIRSYLEENFALVPEDNAIPTAALSASDTDPQKEPVTESALNVPSGRENPAIPEATADTGDPSGDSDPVDTSDRPHPPHSGRTQPPKTPLMERFALSQGYQKSDAQRFIHADGRVLIKSEGVFPWAVRDVSGVISQYFWPREHCLELKPLDLPTEVWHLIEQDPQHHALLLEDRSGEPILFPGNNLVQSKQIGHLRLHPASYRISLQNDL